jgi:RNA polymerase sigma-70 factor (ECF subfamily)
MQKKNVKIYRFFQLFVYKEEKLLEKKFEAFFMHYFPKVKNFAWKLIKSEEDAEDVAQEIFLKLWKTPDLWNKDTTAFDSYLYKMTKNKVIDLMRQRYNEPDHFIHEPLDTGMTEIAQDGVPLSDIYYKEIRLMLKLALEQMPEQRRRIFEMSREAGMTNQQIADRLHLSIRTVEHHIYLALSELKKKLIFTVLLPFL